MAFKFNPLTLKFDMVTDSLRKHSYTFFHDWLLNVSDPVFSEAQINAGLEPKLYSSLEALKAEIPVPLDSDDTTAAATEPNFAVIDDCSRYLKLAYWKYPSGVSGEWLETIPPYDGPFIVPAHVIEQDVTNYNGSSSFQFAMGPLLQIITAGNMTELTCKFGVGGAPNDHAWELRKSTLTQSARPALSTFTDIVDGGTISYTTAFTWQQIVASVFPLAVAVDEWYWLGVFQGITSGQVDTIASMRSRGALNEEVAIFDSSGYVYVAGGFPGSVPTPNVVNVSQAYGAVSAKFQE